MQIATKSAVWIFAASALCSSPFVLAQQQTPAPASGPARPAFQMPAPTPNDTLRSVEVQPDRGRQDVQPWFGSKACPMGNC
jgi:hypothetical protein